MRYELRAGEQPAAVPMLALRNSAARASCVRGLRSSAALCRLSRRARVRFPEALVPALRRRLPAAPVRVATLGILEIVNFTDHAKRLQLRDREPIRSIVNP